MKSTESFNLAVFFQLASIISKKAATGAGALVLDIKVGRGSFTKTIEAGRFLAGKLVGINDQLNLIEFPSNI